MYCFLGRFTLLSQLSGKYAVGRSQIEEEQVRLHAPLITFPLSLLLLDTVFSILSLYSLYPTSLHIYLDLNTLVKAWGTVLKCCHIWPLLICYISGWGICTWSMFWNLWKCNLPAFDGLHVENISNFPCCNFTVAIIHTWVGSCSVPTF